MMFELDDLIIYEWQHQVKHKSADDFFVGEKVFLKSNPGFPITVYSLNHKDNRITCIWRTQIKTVVEIFPPECILQYKFASLLKSSSKINICLN